MTHPPLLRAVLAGHFRSDRHALLLMTEQLPEESPVAGDAVNVRQAWSRMVQMQHAFIVSGTANPWAFAGVVKELHACLQESTVLSARDRCDILFALGVGPGYEGFPYDGTGTVYDDKLLRRHWDDWAKDAQEWGKCDYAYWRFVRRWSLAKAWDRADAEVAADDERWRAELAEAQRRDAAEYEASLSVD